MGKKWSILEMLTNLKLSTGTLGLAVKMRVMPAGKDMVRSPVIFTRHLEEAHVSFVIVNQQLRRLTSFSTEATSSSLIVLSALEESVDVLCDGRCHGPSLLVAEGKRTGASGEVHLKQPHSA